MVDRVGLAERGVGPVAVDAGARGVDEPGTGLEPAGVLEPANSAGPVDLGIEPRVLEAGPDPAVSGTPLARIDGREGKRPGVRPPAASRPTAARPSRERAGAA